MLIRYFFSIFFMLLVLECTPSLAETMTITYAAPESAMDTRYDYDNALLKLALEKTKATWGGL